MTGVLYTVGGAHAYFFLWKKSHFFTFKFRGTHLDVILRADAMATFLVNGIKTSAI